VAVINSDNLYPVEALAALRALGSAGLVGFRRDGLLAGNIDEARLGGYAVLHTDDDGYLTDIIEKPDAAQLAGGRDLISMTCWRFRATIFDALRRTPLSVRGEHEIPDAVRLALAHEPFEVVPLSAPVLDLSRRTDITTVAAALAGRRVDP
jgi:glucose-1-phosphate thymidylyltransferase